MATGRRRLTGAAATWLALAAVAGTATTAAAEECVVLVDYEVDESTRYFRPAELYRSGRFVEALEALGPTETARVPAWLDRIRRIEALSKRMVGASLPDEACLEAAALVHTELALHAAAASKDGETEGHLRAATSLLAMLERGSRHSFRRDWLLLLGYWHQSSLFTGGSISLYPRAREFLDQAAEENPEDAEVQLAAGSLDEWWGSLRHGSPADLRRARDRYRRAASVDPSSAEAFTRLGHVLERLAEAGEARESLERAVELQGDPNLIYRALLTLARLAGDAGDVGEAERLYRRAVATRPEWQVGYIALSHALHEEGRRREAARVLEAGLAREPSDLDGYWTYELGLSPRLDATLERLRERVAR